MVAIKVHLTPKRFLAKTNVLVILNNCAKQFLNSVKTSICCAPTEFRFCERIKFKNKDLLKEDAQEYVRAEVIKSRKLQHTYVALINMKYSRK